MKIDPECINHNVARIIEQLVECRYETIGKDKDKDYERGYALMTLGEIGGVIELANALKEVYKE